MFRPPGILPETSPLCAILLCDVLLRVVLFCDVLLHDVLSCDVLLRDVLICGVLSCAVNIVL